MNETRHPLNIPNTLTIARLLAVVPVIYLSRTGQEPAAAALFVVAMLTDCLDGWYAKRHGQETALGLYLDPVVDKIVILALLYELAHTGRIDWVVSHLFLARELLQNAVRNAAARQGQVVGANWMGKTKAVLQTALVAWGLALPALGNGLPGDALKVAAWLVLGVSWCFFARFLWLNRSPFKEYP
ncbi:CDP-alcohol phosphatidyltransferase family protein [Verrucomicrobiota bacterium]